MRRLIFLLFLTATPAHAHELWIDPKVYQPALGQPIVAEIFNGENFAGNHLVYLPRLFDRFEIIAEKSQATVKSRLGNRPALSQPSLGDGLHIVVYQSKPDTLKYASFEKFRSFAVHKGVADIEAKHTARGLGREKFTEVYTRFSKSLVGVGGAQGADRRVGLTAELVALENPYTDNTADGVDVQLFYRDVIRAGAQIELFEKAPDGTVLVTLHQTDTQGRATLPVKPGRTYMADAVILRKPDTRHDKLGAAWESLWANLTFRVPE
jgi:uncharacterized GH25 family protein